MESIEKLSVFFSYAPGIGPKTFQRLLSYFKSVEKIFSASEQELDVAGLKGKMLCKYLEFKSSHTIDSLVQNFQRKGIWVLSYQDFPEGLQSIANPPIAIFGRGDKRLLFEDIAIAIVGSRRPTSYGFSVTESFAKELVENNIVVVSGMALGIDGITHRSVLKNQGKTLAVLGSGIDLPTPAVHEGLYGEIIKNGAVISEYPPGVYPTKGSFPARNRIISAVSRAIIIPEATIDSGALITANAAFSQNKNVYIVPGSIYSNLSQGTNNLLKNGGIPISSVREILEDLGKVDTTSPLNIFADGLTVEEREILDVLMSENLSIDELTKRISFPVGQLMISVSSLELRNIIQSVNGEWAIVR